MQINKELSIIMDFAEGRITAEEFWEHFKTNGEMRSILINDKSRHSEIWYIPDTMIERGVNPKTYRDASMLYTMVDVFLTGNKINFAPYKFYQERFDFLIDIQPYWLDIRAEDFLISIISQAPQNLTKSQKIKWCKDKIKEYFCYESRPPRWVQSAEWPMNENGKPLVFRRQSKDDIHCELVKFYFYDEDSGKEIVVEQLY